jgi:REP element-mobilizing transposase RayT
MRSEDDKGSVKFDPVRHQRRSVRLPGYDYSAPGAYFVTICTRRRVLYFDQPALRAHAEDCWRAIAAHAPRVTLDEWVVMPNHVHGIIVINDVREDQGRGVQLNAPTVIGEEASLPNVESGDRDPDNLFSQISPRRNTLGVMMRTYKAAVTTAARRTVPEFAFAWQRGFYEHVVRNERELDAIRRYIRDNPLKWALDRDNPQNARRWPGAANVSGYLEDIREYLG